MKYLEIKDNKGYYWNGNKMIEIDQINKDNLLKLLNRAEDDDFEIDEYDPEKLKNKAHQIIYHGIYGKLNDFIQDRESFNKQVDLLYADAIGKYDADLEAEDDEESIINTTEDNNENEIDLNDIPF